MLISLDRLLRLTPVIDQGYHKSIISSRALYGYNNNIFLRARSEIK